MKKTFQKLFCVMASVLTGVTMLSSCSLLSNILKEETEEVYMAVRALKPTGEKQVSLANAEVRSFVENYQPGCADVYSTGKDHFVMAGLTLTWEADNAPNSYTVCLSEDENLSNSKIYTTSDTKLHLDDLYVGTQYYWQITAHYEAKEEKSKINSFKTAYTPRTINIDGVSNTRDLGGKKIPGGQFRQGMVYRGAKLDDITDKGKQDARALYGIKTDLDLRNLAEGTAGSVSPLGEGINYIHVNESPFYLGGTTGINVAKNKEIIATSIKVFADEKNYPIYVHCSLGRDRTAAVCMLIEGLLGMSKTDMEMDYEMSFFSQMGSLDGQTAAYMLEAFSNMYNYIAGQSKGDFAEDCETYLLDAGVTAEEIEKIRSILTK